MESSEAANQLLKNKYDLHKSREVDIAARHTQLRTGERLPQDPLSRIQNYLNRFHEIIDRGGPRRREHNLDLIKGKFYSRYVIKQDEVPEAYFENQKRLAREQGHGDIEITPQMRNQFAEVIIADQRSSLDKWIDYLSSPDAPYSDGLKYFTLRSVLNLAEYDKERRTFPQRSKGTTKPFPDLNREALAYVLDATLKKYRGQNIDLSTLEESDAREFERLLASENFAKLYAWAIEKVTPASAEELTATKGEWVKYTQDSDPIPLVQSLQGHGTGWCTAGESTAATQLQAGDFYVYYSLDREGKATVPRAAIRMEGNRIAEVRGIAPEQNLDSGAVTIVEEKLKEFPDGKSYQKRVMDMRHLTDIENRIRDGQDLSSPYLIFLYEIEAPIEGFGFQKDPRIEEIRARRKPEEDMPIVFGCSKDQIARNVNEIRPDTKAYVGPLVPGIFTRLGMIEHVYTSFPEGKIHMEPLEIGGRDFKTPFVELEEKLNIKDGLTWNRAREIVEQARTGSVQISRDTLELLSQLADKQINVSGYALDMLKSANFITLPNTENLWTVRLKVQDLARRTPTTDEVYARAAELGLGLCPAELGVYQRLKDTNQPVGGWYWIAMKQIADRHGHPDVFMLGRLGDGLWLDGLWANPSSEWHPEDGFVFGFRKEISNPQKLSLLNRLLRR